MAKFLIEYRVPQSDPELWNSVVQSFEDTAGIAAREWAEDYGYSLADKGPFVVKEIKGS